MPEYILWNPSSDKPPKKVFTSEGQAEHTALWASRENAGETFFICEIKQKAHMNRLVPPDEET